jgi:hypothetical protein
VRHPRPPNASTSQRARRTRGASREQPPQRHRGDLRVVRHPRRATSASCVPAPSDQMRAQRHDTGTELLLLSLYCSLLSTCSTFCMYYR